MTTWKLPPLAILNPGDDVPHAVHVDRAGVATALREHKIGVESVEANIGPQAIRYLVSLEPGTLPAKVERATPAVSLALGVPVRYAGVHGTAVALEAARPDRAGVALSRVLEQAPGAPGAALPIPVGVDLDGLPVMADLARLPHLIVAGTTGAGKSGYLHAVVTSLLMRTTPDDVRLHLVDPKHVELTAYEGAPHVETIVTSAPGALDALKTFVAMMDTRYAMLGEAGVKNVDDYNAKAGGAVVLERHVFVVEELADLLMTPVGPAIGKRLERVAQLGRAAGLHLVVATQRPSAKVLPELLRANVPARAVFAVSTHGDGMVALGEPGADKTLTGAGDGLFKAPGVGAAVRFQSPWVSPDEVARVVEWWRAQVPVSPPSNHLPGPAMDVPASDPGAALRASLDLEAAQRDAERAADMAEVGLTPSYRTPEDMLAGYGFTDEMLDALAVVLVKRITGLGR